MNTPILRKTPITWFIVTLAVVSATLVSLKSESSAKNPTEVGTVSWRRDYNAALADSKKSGKPIFLFFQEVPG